MQPQKLTRKQKFVLEVLDRVAHPLQGVNGLLIKTLIDRQFIERVDGYYILTFTGKQALKNYKTQPYDKLGGQPCNRVMVRLTDDEYRLLVAARREIGTKSNNAAIRALIRATSEGASQ